MALPKYKPSKSRGRLRRASYKIKDVNLAPCSNCGTMKQPHQVCPNCGYYKGKKVELIIEKTEKKEKKEGEEKKDKE
ncbi:MAG TPA: 50S ribosomal protein L32 [bacterium]|nr:50S ribosomal protein L32 [bacterium]HOL47188.1 50S ribosomal protein L32 [bacterium]HPQ17680.1 50S ribosomal protein L32 [bacterium]